MRFAPGIDAYFDILRKANPPPLDTLTVEQARAMYRLKSDKFGGPRAEMAEIRDFACPGPGGPIGLRLYRPTPATGPQPALVYLHGGGWTIGDLDSHDHVCRAIAAAAGWPVVAVDYALAPERPFPAGVNDVLAAFGWIAHNAAELGLDARRLAIGGDSAGGNLSAVACLALRDAGGPAPLCQVLIYPAVDCALDPAAPGSRADNARVPPLTTEALVWFNGHYFTDPAQASDWRASPLRAAGHAGLPPALIVTAEYDVLRDEGRAYARALAQAGVAVTQLECEGQIHGFIELGGLVPGANAAIADIAGFLKVRLAS